MCFSKQAQSLCDTLTMCFNANNTKIQEINTEIEKHNNMRSSAAKQINGLQQQIEQMSVLKEIAPTVDFKEQYELAIRDLFAQKAAVAEQQ